MGNMLIAILLESFSEAKAMSASGETLPEQIIEYIQRSHDQFRGRGMKMARILTALEKKRAAGEIEEVTCIHTKYFVELVPGIDYLQAKKLLKEACHFHDVS